MRRRIGVYPLVFSLHRQRGHSNFACEIKEIFCNEPRNGGTSFTTGLAGWLSANYDAAAVARIFPAAREKTRPSATLSDFTLWLLPRRPYNAQIWIVSGRDVDWRLLDGIFRQNAKNNNYIRLLTSTRWKSLIWASNASLVSVCEC